MKLQKYASINGLRALSILLVIIGHLNVQYGLLQPMISIRWLRPLTDMLYDGHLGVNVFFVISGFLITSLMMQEEAITGKISLKNFYIRRTLRIFPAYYTLLLVYGILQYCGYLHLSSESWLTALTYTKYFNWTLDWYTAHAWSLSIEEHFYLFWPLIFLAGDKRRKHLAFALTAAVPLVRTFTYFHPVSWMNDLTLFTRIDSIAIGCLVALYREEIIRLLRPYWTSAFLISGLLLMMLRYASIVAAKVHLEFIFIPLGLTHGTIGNILIAVIMVYSVFGPESVWYRFLNLRLLNYIGILSYSIYLWQEPFLYRTGYWVNQLPQNLLMVVLFALGSYYLVEKPFLKLKSKFSGING
ncbi:MAG: acyltransferase [Candidatus Kapaibacterium sp.]